MANTNTSRPMHLGQDPYNDQFSNFNGSDLGSSGLEPLMSPEPSGQPQGNYMNPVTGELQNLNPTQLAALHKKMGS